MLHYSKLVELDRIPVSDSQSEAAAGTSIAPASEVPGEKDPEDDRIYRSESRELSRPSECMEQAWMARRHDRGADRSDDHLRCRSAAVTLRHEAQVLATRRPCCGWRDTDRMCSRGVVRSARRARTVEASLSAAFGRSTDKRAPRLFPRQRSAIGHRFSGSALPCACSTVVKRRVLIADTFTESTAVEDLISTRPLTAA